jgi:YVTN family beta-propeller protein
VNKPTEILKRKKNTMKTLSRSLNIILLVLALTQWADSAGALPGGTIYVGNFGDDTVSVISLSTLTLVTNIAVGDSPNFVLLTPDGSKAYVANQGSNTVSVILTSTDTVVATIPVGKAPRQLASSRDGRRVYVANSGSGSISMIDTISDSVIMTLNTTPLSRPSSLAFHPIRNEIWIGYNDGDGAGRIEARSATDLSLLASTPGGFYFWASFDLAFLPDGTEAYGAEGCGFCGRFHRISGTYSGGAIGIIQSGLLWDNQGHGLATAVNPVTSRAYFAKLAQNGGANRVIEFDKGPVPHFGRTNIVSGAPYDLAVTPDGKFLLVANNVIAGVVSVIDTASFATVSTVNVGKSPISIAIKPNPPVNLTIAVADVQICWNSSSNTLYQIEYKSSIGSSTWTAAGPPVPGNGSTNCLMENIISDPQRVYRVRVVD